MEFIQVNQDNIEKEHICCCIADKKGENCVASKKAWMKERFQDGLGFLKLNVQGKVFIEYMPAKNAWYPLDAEGYMQIDCFWVSGQYKGQGYSNQLLDACIADAREKGMLGITVIASDKKKPFLSEPGYLKHRGFRACDCAAPYYVLYYLPFTEDAPVPKFKECAKKGRIDEKGMVLYYTNQCPYTAKYVPLMETMAEKEGVTLSVHKIETMKQAQEAPSPFTTFSFFYDGSFITNEIFSEKKFAKFIEEHR